MKTPDSPTQQTIPATLQALAEAVSRVMWADDAASRALGMAIDAVGPGTARLSMTVRADMLNGFQICHGGVITTLADSAFAFACNSRNRLTVAAAIAVDLLAPAHEGDRLTADAREVVRRGRNGIFDITVTNQKGETVAVMRGRSHTIKDKFVISSLAGLSVSSIPLAEGEGRDASLPPGEGLE